MNIILTSAFSGILLMFSGFLFKKNKIHTVLAVCLLILTLISGIFQLSHINLISNTFDGMLYHNRYGLLFYIVLCILTIYYILLNHANFSKVNKNNVSDFFALILFSFTGIALLAQFSNLIMMFLGIEILSIPMYILAGSDKNKLSSTEASIKYFITGSFSTGIMLMGICLLYGATGTFDMGLISQYNPALTTIYFLGWILLIFSLCFKVSVAPFHFWVPDVYDGTPTVFTSYMSTIVKGAAFLAFINILKFFPYSDPFVNNYNYFISVIILLTLLISNYAAMTQKSVKRMMAYSSVAQAGFMMFMTFQINKSSEEALLYYLISYSIAGTIIFYALNLMKKPTYKSFEGLSKKEPIVSFAILMALLSLAGIPLTSGFLSKFFMISSTMDYSNNIILVLFALIFSVISVFYYFKLIIAIFFKKEDKIEIKEVSIYTKSLLILGSLLILVLGVFPNIVSILIDKF